MLRKLMLIGTLCVAVGLGMGLVSGHVGAAHAAAAATVANADRPASELDRDGDGHPGLRCARLARRIMKACPCAGPDGNGWASHDAFVKCVTDAVKLAEDNGAPAGCGDRIVKRATQSKIGEAGFQCRSHERGGDGGDGEF